MILPFLSPPLTNIWALVPSLNILRMEKIDLKVRSHLCYQLPRIPGYSRVWAFLSCRSGSPGTTTPRPGLRIFWRPLSRLSTDPGRRCQTSPHRSDISKRGIVHYCKLPSYSYFRHSDICGSTSGPDHYLLTIFCFHFVKNHRFAWRANQWPLVGGNTILFCSSQKLFGLFELTWCPSRALDWPGALLPDLQRYKDTISQVWSPRCRDPRTPSITNDANLDWAFVENALFNTVPW